MLQSSDQQIFNLSTIGIITQIRYFEKKNHNNETSQYINVVIKLISIRSHMYF